MLLGLYHAIDFNGVLLKIDICQTHNTKHDIILNKTKELIKLNLRSNFTFSVQSWITNFGVKSKPVWKSIYRIS